MSQLVAEENTNIDVAVFGANYGVSGFEAGVFGLSSSPEGYGVYSAGNFAVEGNATFLGEVKMTGVNGFYRVHPYFGGATTTLLGSFEGTELYPQLRFLNSVNGQEFIDIGQNANGDFVVEGSDTEQLVVSRTTGNATFSGNVQATGVSTGAEAVKIVRGVIGPDGTILSGSGFTVTHDDVGIYTVTFDEPFSDFPAVSNSVINIGFVQIGLLSATTATFWIRNPSSLDFFDSNFTFMAMGGAGGTSGKTTSVLSSDK